jgi:hypothetical protein
MVYLVIYGKLKKTLTLFGKTEAPKDLIEYLNNGLMAMIVLPLLMALFSCFFTLSPSFLT